MTLKTKRLMSEIKPKSRRGRKPKIKESENVQQEMIVKKKRGRKKKCEMNLENIPKISGYNPNGESIDTQDNKVKFGINDNTSEASDDCENLSFGVLNIKRHNVVRRKDEPKEQNIFDNGKCLIKFEWIVDNTKNEESEKTQKIQKKENNLSNFFDVKPQEKIINYSKKGASKHESAKTTVNKNKDNIELSADEEFYVHKTKKDENGKPIQPRA